MTIDPPARGLPPHPSGYEGEHDLPVDPSTPPGRHAPALGALALRQALVIVDVVVRLAPQPASVAVARRMVTEALATVDVDPAALEDIRLAVSEACSNAVLHGPVDDLYEVSVHLRGDRCELVVRDGGTDLDDRVLPGWLPSPTAATGRGLAIMRAVMDEVDVTADPGRGTVVRLVKHLDRRD